MIGKVKIIIVKSTRIKIITGGTYLMALELGTGLKRDAKVNDNKVSSPCPGINFSFANIILFSQPFHPINTLLFAAKR